MSWYRDKYLKSEDWRNLSRAVISHFGSDGKCRGCGEVKKLEPHHLKYRRIYDVLPWDFLVVCRDCHTRIHKILDLFPEIKVFNVHKQRKWLKALLTSRATLEARISKREDQIKALLDRQARQSHVTETTRYLESARHMLRLHNEAALKFPDFFVDSDLHAA